MHTLVPSDRVEHVAVYGRDGTRLGTIERLMLEKVTGTVAYAVIRIAISIRRLSRRARRLARIPCSSRRSRSAQEPRLARARW